MKKGLILFVSLLLACNVNGLTLEEYGITPTTDGLTDDTTGLRWLDSSLSPGDLSGMQTLFDEGWRVASEEEYFYLVSRQLGTFGSDLNSSLNYADFQWVMERLAILDVFDLPGNIYDNPNPWLCRPSSSPDSDCGSTDLLGGQFVFTYEDAGLGNGTDFSTFTIVFAMALYENSDNCIIDQCSRALLVRQVPLPLSLVLFLSALGSLGVFQSKR